MRVVLPNCEFSLIIAEPARENIMTMQFKGMLGCEQHSHTHAHRKQNRNAAGNAAAALSVSLLCSTKMPFCLACHSRTESASLCDAKRPGQDRSPYSQFERKPTRIGSLLELQHRLPVSERTRHQSSSGSVQGYRLSEQPPCNISCPKAESQSSIPK